MSDIHKKPIGTYALLYVIRASVGLLLSTSLQSAPNVAVSIAPIHSLVAGVMDGVGVPELLIPVAQSPHDYALKPSVVKHIYDADLIIWIGAEYETALNGAIDQASKRNVTRTLGSLHELTTYPVRTGVFWEDEQHNQDHNDKDGGHEHPLSQPYIDPHVWLSTANSKTMVTLFRDWLTAIDSENAEIYQNNAERLIARINMLQSYLQQQIRTGATSPYIVFHDAYQYFEKEFNLHPLGVITLNPKISPGAKRLQTLRKMIAANDIKCLFKEPQFESKWIPLLIENTNVSLRKLDPLGTDSQSGTELWFELMAKMGQSLSDCL